MTDLTDDLADDSLDIAIIGMAGRFPGADSVARLWANLLAGTCAATTFTPDELTARGVDLDAPEHVPIGYPVAGSDGFDAAFFGISPREAELMDPQHRVLLECAWSAMESAGHAPGAYPGPVGVYVGAGYNTYLLANVATQPGAAELVLDKQTVVGNRSDFLGGRVSYKLGMEGPSVNIQSACSTSLVAVVEACQALLAFQCDMALAGGVAVDHNRLRGYRYQPGGILSPDGLTRTFDARAQGTVGGDGVGVVVLKRLRDAEADGDHVHAVIKGTAVNNDGARRAGFTAPAAATQAAVITAALAAADVDPATVGYVELHGTATPLGDPIEFAALTSAFAGVEAGSCLLGSVKTNIGHLDSAAGVAGLIKAVLAVEHGVVPASLHFSEPNPRIALAGSPFAMATETQPWPGSGPRRAGVSSFGLGGTNAHVVLEQAPPRPPRQGVEREELLVLSAKTATALDALTDRLHEHLRAHPDLPLADVAGTLRAGRRELPHRRALVATSRDAALDALAVRDDGRLLTGHAGEAADRPVAFVFTGFGSQFPGMARSLHADEPAFRAAFDECADLLLPLLDQDIRPLVFTPSTDAPTSVFGGPPRAEHPLDGPLLGYPATFALGYALAGLWASWGVRPDVMIGHSLGETVAACLAGVFTLPDALRLVVARARLIEAGDEGAMMAVALAEDAVAEFLDDEVSPAAVNGPATCVLSGTVAGIERVGARLAAAGHQYRLLASRHAFHSPLMDPVVEPYERLVAEVALKPPTTRFVSNVTGTWITDEQATDPAYWARHLRRPVRFADGVAALWSVPDVVVVEIGPSPTLTSAVLQHPAAAATDRVVVPSLAGTAPGRTDRAALLHAAARLWLAGKRAPFEAGPVRRVPLPTYPFERKRFWLEPGTPSAAGPSAHRRTAGGDWFHSPSWTRLTPAPPADRSRWARSRWLVFADGGGIGHDLAAALRDRGADVRTVVPEGPGDHVLVPGDERAATALADELRASGALPDRVVHCWATGDPGAHDVDAEVDRGFGSLLHWAKAVHHELMTTAQRWDVVTTGVCAVLGDEPLSPTRAAVRGLARVLGQEYPSLTCVHHDVPDGGVLDGGVLDILLDGLAHDGDERTVALRGRSRWAPTYVVEEPPAGAEPVVVPGGVYLITGGLGKIGLLIARALAERERVRLVLVGRSGLRADGPPETARAVQDLRELGAEVLVSAVDVADADAVARLKAEVLDRFGRVDGLFHCAGTTGRDAHRSVDETGAAEVAWHFDPKVRGPHVLREALADQDLKAAVLCSSVAALLGGLGFAAYAAANAVLDAFAHAHHGPGEPWMSVDWEAWLFTDEERAAHGAGSAVGELALTAEEGRSVVDRLLTIVPRPQLAVSTGDLTARERLWAAPAAAAPAPTRHERPALHNPYVAPDGPVERRIADIWQDVLGVTEVGAHDNFFDLGGSSLLGLKVVHRLRGELGAAVPLTVVYEGPTVRTLAAVVGGLRDDR
ncbi:acyl transferase domain-containing protein [Saccharothrix tamanrassetensis]|uniref:Acyl transferase domain-containing protein n=1 Tax=Saccharothrix tamanrassetensis TaxID=1051531 RepID=A0A841CWN8_9PSEU|nr:type I polyketide synthase [Saccharothrix tamanrassetensis]MBB5960724.1 acyl transferase domain-containing protein [Saccharothrix tamanrassetensis]